MRMKRILLLAAVGVVVFSDRTRDELSLSSLSIPKSSRTENEMGLTPIRAKEALLQMMQKSKSRIICECIEMTRSEPTHILEDKTVLIGVWVCNLEKRTFLTHLGSPVHGVFVQTERRDWLAIPEGDGDLPPSLRKFLNRMR